MMEAYQAFGDYETMMELLEGMITHVAQSVLGTLVIKRNRNLELQTFLNELIRLLSYFLANAFGQPGTKADEELQHALINGFPIQANYDLQTIRSKLASTSYVKVAEEALTRFDAFLAELDKTRAEKPQLFYGAAERQAANQETIAQARKSLERFIQEAASIDLTRPWKRARYKDLVREKAGADWFDVSPAERRRRAIEDLKLEGDIAAGYEDFEVTGAVFEKLIEPTLIQPTFVTHLPKELVPLAKLSPDDPTTVEVFELCINGQEIAPGYTEQNNPIEQRERLEHQAGGEQQKLDEDFLVALEHGMPPAGGIGIGIDRLCMMLLGQESIRDVILFPQLKPK
jgi:lysyl-tRNA synthetase class 2